MDGRMCRLNVYCHAKGRLHKNAKTGAEGVLKFLFWNVAQRAQPELIKAICQEQDVDVLALAELDRSPTELMTALNAGNTRPFGLIQSVAVRVQILTRLPERCVQLVSDDGRIFIRRVSPPTGLDIILVAVHLPSKLHMSDDEQTFEAVRLMQSIEAAESRIGHNRTIVIGDLNMNPFENGLIAADGLHSTMDRRIAARSQRTVNGKQRRYMYNPMWRFFASNANGAQGTFFRRDNSHLCLFWNIFDQVLIRPDLLDYFVDKDVSILESAGGTPLVGTDGKIDVDISDHLPIIATLNLETAL